MENFKVNLWAFLKKANAYGCMLSYSFLLLLILCPLWILMYHIGIRITTIIIIMFIIICIVMTIIYILLCRTCINRKVDEICKECKAKKLNICNETIKRYKSSNYNEASSQINRINKEISKVSKMKKDESTKTLLQHLKDELERWEEIKNKNF
ncbi:MAG: hypothetical protein [Wendovervirus sonii]|uniref:Uncharacterized protein n=1 Tax=phage Lak_Megaphage_Sonny TaxID=3109229 RepID=A0ABZ0Z2J5_9CAUD|nr:MAG: hypothetical protein [phage Lak_Megaphage_Sonny]